MTVPTWIPLLVMAALIAARPPKTLARRTLAACSAAGPCQQPDALDVFLGPGDGDVVVAANFGLLYPSRSLDSWTFICEETFGAKLSRNGQFHPDGRVFLATLAGLLISGTKGCSWTRGGGELQDAVWDVAVDASMPTRVWAIAGERRSLFLSTDSGNTFATKRTFDSGQRFIRVSIARSDSRVMYLAGHASRVPLILGVSTDGGESWAIDNVASEGIAGPGQTADLVAIDPEDPSTSYLSVLNATGDQIWRLGGFGKTKTMILALPEGAEARGFTLGATAKDMFVAAKYTLETSGKPPAALFVSHDGGVRWTQRPVPATGPRFRCLRHQDGKLFACGGDLPSGDSFLLGVSHDEGVTWEPTVRLGDLTGASACNTSTCAITSSWLCANHGICDGVSLPDAGVDGRADAAPATPAKRGGCTIVATAQPAAGMKLTALAALVLLARRRKSSLRLSDST